MHVLRTKEQWQRCGDGDHEQLTCRDSDGDGDGDGGSDRKQLTRWSLGIWILRVSPPAWTFFLLPVGPFSIVVRRVHPYRYRAHDFHPPSTLDDRSIPTGASVGYHDHKRLQQLNRLRGNPARPCSARQTRRRACLACPLLRLLCVGIAYPWPVVGCRSPVAASWPVDIQHVSTSYTSARQRLACYSLLYIRSPDRRPDHRPDSPDTQPPLPGHPVTLSPCPRSQSCRRMSLRVAAGKRGRLGGPIWSESPRARGPRTRVDTGPYTGIGIWICGVLGDRRLGD
jgi:hypothetical protein